MTRIILQLSDTEESALRQQAEREYRAPRDQARLLLMRALGFVQGEARTISSREVALHETQIIDAVPAT